MTRPQSIDPNTLIRAIVEGRPISRAPDEHPLFFVPVLGRSFHNSRTSGKGPHDHA